MERRGGETRKNTFSYRSAAERRLVADSNLYLRKENNYLAINPEGNGGVGKAFVLVGSSVAAVTEPPQPADTRKTEP